MSNVFFPSLTEDGWVTDSLKIADYALAQFFASDYSQSQIYAGNVASLAYLNQQHNGDPQGLAKAITETLTRYLGSYLTGVKVDCSVNAIMQTSSDQALNLYVSFIDETNTTITLAKMLKFTDSKLTQIVTINNDG